MYCVKIEATRLSPLIVGG